MPGGDGTGPNGMGPLTGRGAGRCAGYPAPGYANSAPGRGFGLGLGRRGGGGRGYRVSGGFRGRGAVGAAYYGDPRTPEMDPGREAEMLRMRAKAMQDGIDAINERIRELGSGDRESR